MCQNCDSVFCMSAQSSRLRQRLVETAREYQKILGTLLQERGPLIRGSFGTRARLCGRPGCRCVQGFLHESKYLTASDGGKARQIHVPAHEELHVAKGVERYRRFWQMRARLTERVKLQLELIDRLGRSLLEPYPPGKPLPPASRRGRTPKGARDRQG